MGDESEIKVAAVGKAAKKLKKLKKKKIHPVEEKTVVVETSMPEGEETNVTKKLTKKKKKKKTVFPPVDSTEDTAQVIPAEVTKTSIKAVKKKKKIHPVENNDEQVDKVAENADEPGVKKSNKKKIKITETETGNETIETVTPSKQEANSEEMSKRALKKYRPTGANSNISNLELEKLKVSLIRSVKSLDELKKKVSEMTREGKLGADQAGQIIRKWRGHDRQVGHLKKKEVLLNELSNMADSCESQTIDDVKNLVNRYVDEGKISRIDAGTVIKNWKRSEHRRVERQLIKQKERRCLFCRQSGHMYANCPKRDQQTMGSGICFKCGSAEHTSGRCPRKNVKGFPYAVCFVCKQQGHLSRDCDNNPNGIYPDGGSCDLCGSQKHLKKDCVELKMQVEGKGKRMRAVMGTAMSGGDEDIILGGEETEETTESLEPQLKKPRKKIVQF